MSLYKIPFKEGVEAQVEIDEKNFLFYASPIKSKSIPDQEKVIEDALENPIGTGKIEDLVQPQNKVALLVDDITRPTPTARILPHVLSRIERAGVPKRKVKIIMALGTHRPMTEKELEVKLGKEVIKNYEVINRHYQDRSKLIFLGETESGTPVEVYQEVAEADFVLAVGNIVPHISSGWGGGSKIILPGVCGQKTTDMMHYAACTVQSVLEVIGKRDNKPRQEMDEIAEKAGLKFIVNTILDEKRNILDVFAGDYIEAHRKAVKEAEKYMLVPVPHQADILIVSATPCHVDYWQGVKPYAFSHRAVRQGGIIIFLLDGSEGLCGDAPSHEETVRKYISSSFEEMKKAVEKGKVTDLAGLNVPMYHSMLRHRVTTFCVSNNLSKEDITALGFIPADNVQSALDEAYRILGKDAKVGIIPYGGKTLVKIRDNSEFL